jgi:hypothetical protein
MPTLYTRRFSFKDSLTDEEVLEEWRFIMDEAVPAVQKVRGSRSIKLYSRAGALRSDLTIAWEMDDAGVYERALLSSDLRRMLGRLYGNWDLKTSTQSFRREVTPELIHALSSTG